MNCQNTITIKNFDRIIDFNKAECTITVEAGCTLGKLYNYLGPLGLQLPVQPGYPAITIGGCVAVNVHGKNHVNDGYLSTFSN